MSSEDLARARLAAALPPNVRTVCQTLASAGHQAVAVGGAVRDAILGRAPGDWDIATSARPEQVMTLFRHTVPTGLAHGTVTVVTGRGEDSHVEVTTFRGEGSYTDARRPDHVTFGVPLVEDLARRDLRVNAIAYDPASDRLIDPYQGQVDIAERRLRAVGPTGNVYDDAVARFTEDGLRVMRAVRFAAALEFELDPDTERGIVPALPSLAKVSRERVSDELRKILAARQPSRALAIAERIQILALILPELVAGFDAWAAALAVDRTALPFGGAAGRGSPAVDRTALPFGGAAGRGSPAVDHGDVLTRWLARVDAAPAIARLGALVCELAAPPSGTAGTAGDAVQRRLDRRSVKAAEAVLRRLKFSNDESTVAALLAGTACAVLVAGWSGAQVRRLLADVGRSHAAAAVALWRASDATELADHADAILARGDALAVNELAVTGKDLLTALDMRPGPALGRILAALLERVIADPALNTPDALIATARTLELELAR